jgi:predicted enzyme related to lactoylglutathione lyase
MQTTTAIRVTGIDATYYTVQDLAGCTEFYSNVLGQGPTVAVPDFFTEWTFADGSSFGLYKSEQTPPSRSGSAMFRVADVAQAAAHLKELGALAAHGGEDSSEFETCFMAFGHDPEGNQFIIHKRKE